MRYSNPVILSDYSDPDVIRVGEDFYMVASSFNHVPGVPVLHSKNLVEWELINYVLPRLPFDKFKDVCHGEGAWAPSIRFHNDRFYCLIPFPDEGIYVSETADVRKEWSPLRPLFESKGSEDPCPVWADGKCYVVMAFAKSRAGFNSKLAVFETDEKLEKCAHSYTFIYDGHDNQPNIEGPKFYRRGGYFYILAPAGGVKTGWQTALRSKNVYGPYESKIIMVQGDTDVNGPHQGALVDLDDGGERWAFMHFQDMGPYGRVVHLQPARWVGDWVLAGNIRDENLPGNPVSEGDFPVEIKTGYALPVNDDFSGGKLSLQWQTPANPQAEWFSFGHGLKLNCVYYGFDALSDLPQLLMQKIAYRDFTVKTKCKLNLVNDGDEVGFTVFGEKYAYICVVRRDGRNFSEIREGEFGADADRSLCQSQPFDEEYATFQVTARYEEKNKMSFKFTLGGSAFTHKFYASNGRWVGAKLGIYARSTTTSDGNAVFRFFRVTPH